MKGYQLPNTKFCTQNCNYCHGLGHKSDDKTYDQIMQSYLKAKSASYDYIVFPCNTLFRKDWEQVLGSSYQTGLKIILQIHIKYLNPRLFKLLIEQYPKGCRFQVVLEEINKENLIDIQDFHLKLPDSTYLLILQQDLNLIQTIGGLSNDILMNMFLYSPLKLSSKDPFLTTNEVYEMLDLLTKKYPKWKNRFFPGLDVYDSRINKQSNLESLIESQQLSKTERFDPLFSVVIPTYNNKNYVRNTLRHLHNQSLKTENYEVIIVDDGSDDGTKEAISRDLLETAQKINVQYIFLPREQRRVMGDGGFRAGVARNLGVKYSSGENICFLDSDILTPPYFLVQLLKDLQVADVVQAKRMYLKKDVSSELTNYHEINTESDTYIPEGGYWHKFYQDPVAWDSQQIKWKYVCTYTLAMKRALFCDVGWFRKNYHFYGFEDTDLGYRLAKQGARLYLSELEVLHLFHEDQRSEYKNSEFHRYMLLKKTAKLFFLNNLESEIYQALPNLVSEESIVSTFIKKVYRKFKNHLWTKSMHSTLETH